MLCVVILSFIILYVILLCVIVLLCKMALSVMFYRELLSYFNAECLYSECRYAEGHGTIYWR